MLSPKPWKVDALLRLLFGVFLCIYGGSVVMSALHYSRATAKSGPAIFFPVFVLALGCLAVTLVLVGRPWRLENLSRRLLLLGLCAYAGLFLGAWAQKISGPIGATSSVERMVVATLSFQGATLILTARFLREHQMSWDEAFGLSRDWRQALMLGVIF